MLYKFLILVSFTLMSRSDDFGDSLNVYDSAANDDFDTNDFAFDSATDTDSNLLVSNDGDSSYNNSNSFDSADDADNSLDDTDNDSDDTDSDGTSADDASNDTDDDDSDDTNDSDDSADDDTSDDDSDDTDDSESSDNSDSDSDNSDSDGDEEGSNSDDENSDDDNNDVANDEEDFEDPCEDLDADDCGNLIDENGDALCGYNANMDECYGTVRRAGSMGAGGFDDGYVAAENAAKQQSTQLQAVIGVLGGLIGVMIIVIGLGGYYFYKRSQKEVELGIHSASNEHVSPMEQTIDVDNGENMVSNHNEEDVSPMMIQSN